MKLKLFLAIGATFAGVTTLAQQPTPPAPISYPPNGPNPAHDSAPLYSGFVRSSFYVPVRDGTRLAMNVYRPAVNGRAVEERLPVLFLFTPYRARFRNEEGATVETGIAPNLGLAHMTDHGYVVAVADIRGKGASFGHRRGFQDRTEARDGYDLVEWLARQPWSNGNIGMTGCSYLGGTTIQVASTAPPHLRAVFAGSTDFDKFDFVRQGGITGQFNTRPDEPSSVDLASIAVDADADGALLRAAVAEHMQNTQMAPLWYGMPYRDSMSPLTGTRFWEEVGPYTYLDTLRRSHIAFFIWSNWTDEPAAQALLLAANLGGRLMVGPGSHCVTPPGVDLGAVQRHFFDPYLRGVHNGIEREPRYHWWTLDRPDGAQWTASDVLPGEGVRRTPLYLSSAASGTIRSIHDGSLAAAPASPGADSFQTDYGVGNGHYFDFWPAVLDEHGLTYTSPPLAADVTMSGYPVITLDVASDQPGANIFAYLEDVAPDGVARNISFGRLALSYRQVSRPPYDLLGLPYHSGLQADQRPVLPGQTYRIAIALGPSSKRFEAGHRLRVSIRGADPRQRNLAEIRRTPAERITVRSGGVSHVDIPFLGPVRFAGR